MKEHLIIFDGTSYFVIPSFDWHLYEDDATIHDQYDDIEEAQQKTESFNLALGYE